MKKIFFISAAFVLFQINIFSQSSTTMLDILETVTDKVTELEQQRNQEIVNMTFDLLVGRGEKRIWRYLDPAFEYEAFLLGDRRIENLKLTVYKKDKKSNEWIFVDQYSAPKPHIRIIPSDYEMYEFTVSVESYTVNNSTAHFALILYHQNPERGY
jgi:hypothetical protein